MSQLKPGHLMQSRARQPFYSTLYNGLCKTRVLIGLEECVIRV